MAGIRTKLGYKAIRKLKPAAGRAIEMPVFRNLQRIGVVYERTIAQTNAEIDAFVREMREAGKMVVELIYVAAKKLPAELSNELNRIYISKANTDWRSLPKKESVIAFTREEFDCLLNFDLRGSLTLQAVSAMSKAKLRVGAFNQDFEFCHDLMLQNREQGSANYISQIKHYFNFAV